MTFYLKYRPQTIEELDLTNVRTQLTQVLSSKSIPHAFLFSGSRGLGKTSAARILAKAINCTDKKKLEPCNKCDACLSITQGNSMDVIEIDGASNRGIDDIRALRESVALAPLSLQKKIYIIDEVHMLTKEAFNALLKTLEEPPEHVVFILATTEPHKLPETIISRTFHIQFQRASKEEMNRSLQRPIKGENLQIEDLVLDQIISQAKGGFRDSVKVLEQLAFFSKNINQSTYDKIFSQSDIDEFLIFLKNKNAKLAFEWIENQEEAGVDWQEIIRKILERLRQIMLANYEIGTKKEIQINQQQVSELIELCIQASINQKSTLISTLPLELLVAKWCGKQELDKKESPEKQVLEIENTKNKTTNIVSSKPSASDDSKKVKPKKKLTITLDEIKNKWEELLLAIRPQNHSLESFLRGARPWTIDGETLSIKVYYGFHKERLETDKCLKIAEKTFETVFGQKTKINYVLGKVQEKQKIDQQKGQELEKTVEEVFS
jgi:DNA polymerase III subunit gamma/tau